MKELASHLYGPGFDSQPGIICEFVGSLLCFEGFFSGYSSFPPSAKINFKILIRYFQGPCQLVAKPVRLAVHLRVVKLCK